MSQDSALDIIRQAMAKLMNRQFFYYNIAKQFALKEADPKTVPSMGVAHIDGVHWLVYNPSFVKLYDFKELSVILEHEIDHFVFDHVKHFDSSQSARKIFKDEKEAADYVRDVKMKRYIHSVQNKATDRSINVYLKNLPGYRHTYGEMVQDIAKSQDPAAALSRMQTEFEKGNMKFLDPSITLETATAEDIVEGQCITEKSFKELLIESGYQGDVEKVEKYADWKYYFDLLMSCPDIEKNIDNIKDMDIHFGDEDERDGEQARDRIIMEAARNSNRHDIPGDLRDHIKSLFDKYKDKPLPWNVILRRQINAARKSIVKNDVNTRNRYYGTNKQIIPGYMNIPIKEIAVIWDVSGSCMDEETQSTFIQECNGLIKAGCEVRAYYTDADVEHIQDCKDKMMPPSSFEITGGGGTKLDRGIVRAIDEGYKIIIMLTDNYMDFDLTKKDLKGRRIINVSTTEAKQPSHYGPQIHVNPR